MARKLSRRGYVAGVGSSIAVGSIAGCTENGGNGDDGPQTIQFLSTSSTATAYAAAQGIASEINQQTDEYQIEVIPTEGSRANYGQMEEGNGEIAYLDHFGISRMHENIDEFAELEFQPRAVHNTWETPDVFVTRLDEIQSIDDITSDHTVSPAPAANNASEIMEMTLEIAGVDPEIEYIGWAEQGSALNEGRIDVAIGAIVNGISEPSWLQEMKSMVDLGVVDIPDSVVSELEDEPLINLYDVDFTQFDGYAFAPDEIRTPGHSGYMYTRADVDSTMIYDYLNLLWDNRDAISETHVYWEQYLNDEFWIGDFYGFYPFHDGAKEFYQEKELWSDDYDI